VSEIVSSGYSEAQVAALLDTLFVSTGNLYLAAMRADLVAGINRLPLSERRLVVYSAMGYSAVEMSKWLGVSRQTVDLDLAWAKLRLLILMNMRGDSLGRERLPDEGDADSGAA
jgi:DNA-directed RNA polymerase specialized sigma24 family protein